MPNTTEPNAPGARAAQYPELDADTRRAIMAGFNSSATVYFASFLGIRVVDVRRGYSRLELPSRSELLQPAGVMHGGASFGLADTAVAAALRSLYPSGSVLLTIEMKINYLEPIACETVVAEAYALRSSRRSAYAEVDIWAGGKLSARATSTYMIREPRA
jgi:uncharacterized protein (TIGR00369 family)